MITKKITGCFFILVLALQLLPIRQVVRYFFVDNPLTEEIAEAGKVVTKNTRFADEDKLMHDHNMTMLFATSSVQKSLFNLTETLPALYDQEVQTPPPNQLAILV